MPRSNVKRVRPSMVFARKSGNDLIGCATAAAQGVLTNPTVFPTPPVDGQTLSAQIAAYGTAYGAAYGTACPTAYRIACGVLRPGDDLLPGAQAALLSESWINPLANSPPFYYNLFEIEK